MSANRQRSVAATRAPCGPFNLFSHLKPANKFTRQHASTHAEDDELLQLLIDSLVVINGVQSARRVGRVGRVAPGGRRNHLGYGGKRHPLSLLPVM